MKLIYNPVFQEHETGVHPEGKKRMEVLNILPVTKISSGEDYLDLVHTKDYIHRVISCSRQEIPLDGDTRTSEKSFEVASLAVGAALQAAEHGDFALVRPPGHHAYADKGSGFCLFNNVAVAVQMLVNEGKRVAIVDFDGHLGDGTSAIFYENPDVLFFSVHQYPAFPGNGHFSELGEGKGKGFNINIPVPPGSGDDIFMDAFSTFLPVVKSFQPNVVALSAGFDAHRFDPLLDLNVTVNTFFKIGQAIRNQFDRYFAVLEGGYNVQVLHQGIFNFMAGISGLDIPYKETETESPMPIWEEYEMRLHQAISFLRPYWAF